MATKLSYAITVCNEHRELDALLAQLSKVCNLNDQIVIQMDSSKVTPEVEAVVAKYESASRFKFLAYHYEFNGDFAEFKNELTYNCTGDYIFQIDADELLGINLLEHIRAVIDANKSEIDMFLVPRLNVLTDYESESELKEYAIRQNWTLINQGTRLESELNTIAINFPDYQTRIYRNVPTINWHGKVHERLIGIKQFSALPALEDWCLLHVKTMDRQKMQNDFYSTLIEENGTERI